MKENKTIEKELLFKSKIKEITSISLDSDYKVENGCIKGNFLINGEYKIHEISINREKFNFKIPFKHDLESDIDCDTVNLEINNFIYDYKQDELIVNIEYLISGDRKDVLLFDDERSLDEFLNNKEIEVIDTRLDEINTELKEQDKEKTEKSKEESDKVRLEEKETKEVSKEENIKDEQIENIESDDLDDNKINIDIKPEDKKERDDNINTDEIMENINNIDDKFVTYKIYKLTESDTLENLVIKFHTTLDELKEYNDLTNIKVNDKLIIPEYE